MSARALAVLLLISATSLRAAPSPLVGAWSKDGAPFAELKSDGSGRVDQDAVSWKADARTLTLVYRDGTVEKMAFTLKGDRITVVMDGTATVLTRAKTGAKAAKASAAGKDQLSSLLLSSAWCSFTYNKYSGASHQERVVFRANGAWDSGARGETYSGGAAGTVAGQSGSSSGGRWQVRGSSLLMSSGRAALEDVGLAVSRNSSGYPILKTGNKEFASCR